MEPAPELSPDTPVEAPAEPVPDGQPELSVEPLDVGTTEPVREPLPEDTPPPTEAAAPTPSSEGGTVGPESPPESSVAKTADGRETVPNEPPSRHNVSDTRTEQYHAAPADCQSGTRGGQDRGRIADTPTRDTGTSPCIREKEPPKDRRTAPGTRSKVKTKEAASPDQPSQAVSLGRQKAVRDKAWSAAAKTAEGNAAETNPAETVSENTFETISTEQNSILSDQTVSCENFTENRPAYPMEDVRDHPAGTKEAYKQPESGTYNRQTEDVTYTRQTESGTHSRQIENAAPVQRTDTTTHSRQPEAGSHSRHPVRERSADQPGAGPDTPKEGRVAVKTRDVAGRDAVPAPTEKAPQTAVRGKEKAVRERADRIAEKPDGTAGGQGKRFTVSADAVTRRAVGDVAEPEPVRTRMPAERNAVTSPTENAPQTAVGGRAKAVREKSELNRTRESGGSVQISNHRDVTKTAHDVPRQPEMPRDGGLVVKTKGASGDTVKTGETNGGTITAKESRPGAEPSPSQDTTPRNVPRQRQLEIIRRETRPAVEPHSSPETISHTLPPENSASRTLPRQREPDIKVRDTRTTVGTVTDTPADYETSTPAFRSGAIRNRQSDIKTQESQFVKPPTETLEHPRQSADRGPIDRRGRGKPANQPP
ncbi:MAG: hypothetical protein J6X53_01760, partial [Abditibacteriota bacterium]|nr:hypothetical protein [Abditibacteriota bacterium]